MFFHWIQHAVSFNASFQDLWFGLVWQQKLKSLLLITQTAWGSCKDLQWLVVFKFHLTFSGNKPTMHRMEAKENVRKISRNEVCVWLSSFPQIIRSRGIALWSSPAFLQGSVSIDSHMSIASVPPGYIKSFLNIEKICKYYCVLASSLDIIIFKITLKAQFSSLQND